MDLQKQGTNYSCEFSRKYVFEIWSSKTGEDRKKQVVSEICELASANILDKEKYNFEELAKSINYICDRIVKYWRLQDYKRPRFLSKYGDWLKIREKICIKLERDMVVLTESESPQPSSAATSSEKRRGRPRVDYLESSKRTKQRRLADLSQHDPSMAQVLNDSSSTHAASLPDVDTASVLSLFVDAKLTKHQYILIKNFVNTRLNASFLPTYENLLVEKKLCSPDPSVMTVTESCAEIELQSLLDHTASRIIELQKPVLDTLPSTSADNLILIGKWGFDGSTGQSEYKQNFTDGQTTDDSSLFVTSYVPLRLFVNHSDSDGQTESKLIWKNPRPCSTRFCRPIRLQFKKETTELSIQEEQYYQDKINSLQPTRVSFNDTTLTIRHELQLTMIDGKVCNALSGSSSLRCYICKATPKEMNDIDMCLAKGTDDDKYAFGLSPLHSWIRFFEYLLHVSYRLSIKKWQVRSESDKQLLADSKTRIQKEFRDRLGLIVDKPKAGGSGTSNDGNTARKFFSNAEISAEITGLDKNLITRCSVILETLSSGYNISSDKFKDYALQTARLLVQAYPWYNLPASVHKVLIHGSQVIKHSLLSIGELSEEAAESRNKDIKRFRLQHTRKMSRVLTNTDLLNRLLLSSDPYISSMRKLSQKKKSLLSKAALDLLEI